MVLTIWSPQNSSQGQAQNKCSKHACHGCFCKRASPQLSLSCLVQKLSICCSKIEHQCAGDKRIRETQPCSQVSQSVSYSRISSPGLLKEKHSTVKFTDNSCISRLKCSSCPFIFSRRNKGGHPENSTDAPFPALTISEVAGRKSDESTSTYWTWVGVKIESNLEMRSWQDLGWWKGGGRYERQKE